MVGLKPVPALSTVPTLRSDVLHSLGGREMVALMFNARSFESPAPVKIASSALRFPIYIESFTFWITDINGKNKMLSFTRRRGSYPYRPITITRWRRKFLCLGLVTEDTCTAVDPESLRQKVEYLTGRSLIWL